MVIRYLRKRGARPDLIFYSTALRKSLFQNNIDFAESLLSDTERDEVPKDARFLQLELSVHLKRRNNEKFHEVFGTLMSIPNLPTTMVRNTYIQMFCLAEDPENALETIVTMRKEGIPITILSYTPIIDHAIKKRDESLILKLMENMEVDNIPPNPSIFLGIMQYYFEKEDLESLIHLATKLNTKGYPFRKETMKYLISIGLEAGKSIEYLCDFIDKLAPLGNVQAEYLLNTLIYKLEGNWYQKRKHEVEVVRAKILAKCVDSIS